MLRKLLFSISFAFLGVLTVTAQTGAIKVSLADAITGETIPFGSISVQQNGSQVAAGATDINGEITVKPLNPGKYDIKATFVGYQTAQTNNIVVSTDKTTPVTIKISSGVDLGPVIVIEYLVPLIDGNIVRGLTLDKDQINHNASQDIRSLAIKGAGSYASDEGQAVSFRGARNGTQYIVDGRKVSNLAAAGVTQRNIEQESVINGGIPAQYGDATGGIVLVTTRGGLEKKFFANVQGETSQYLDQFGHNLLGFSLGGPIKSTRDTNGNKIPLIGYIISGEFTYKKDPNPSVVGVYKVKDDVLSDLEKNPLRLSPVGAGFLRNSEFITMNDLEKIKYRQNVSSMSVSLNSKLQFRLSENTQLTVGAVYAYGNSHQFVYEYALFNPQNNPQLVTNSWSTYGRLTQKFNTGKVEKGQKEPLIKNAYYVLQAEYSHDRSQSQDDSHKGKFFNYGYIGKFTQKKAPYYTFDAYKQAYTLQLYYDSSLAFTPSDINLTAANFTSQVYANTDNRFLNTGSAVQKNLGLLNGDRPTNIYSLWFNTGRQYNSFAIDNRDQFRVFTSFSADIKKHSVQVGFEYEQRIYSHFSVSPIDLWTVMRQEANSHLSQLDTAIFTTKTVGPYQYITYQRKYDGASQYQFDKSLRQKLGLAVNDPTWIDVDSYDPSTFSLSMFSPDELLNNGLANYYGYDQNGKKLKKTPSFDKFFTEKDVNGNYTRQMGALQPIYIAGYLQDQFDIRDLKFRLGVRIDRFDANQKVLKDKYLLYPARTVAEVTNLGSHPSNIGGDYVVYVNDLQNPTAITGYRNGDRWYNAQGVEQLDPDQLAFSVTGGTGHMIPYLVDPSSTAISSSAFKDFKPQLNVMPRIAFAFPISDLAQFNANYDITTQRPYGNLALPTQYLYWPTTGGFFANPDQKPERTTAYEIGFSQILSDKKNSALTLSAFYKEMRNMSQVINVTQAYPKTYQTYSNIDFGTVKGFSVALDIRRTGNAQLNANYTLQFADGTGSSASDGYNLVSSGLPNLRSTIPLSFDRRHTFNITFDYRFGDKEDYKGPVITRKKGEETQVIKVLKNVGANVFITAGSGTPYSRQSIVTEAAGYGIVSRSYLKGSVHGSNLPWSYRVDIKLDKNIVIKWAKPDGAREGKRSNLNVYFLMLNSLNTKNILAVYQYTGNPNDDGFISSVQGQTKVGQAINAESYTDLYKIKVNNPSAYSIPRSIRIGFILDF